MAGRASTVRERLRRRAAVVRPVLREFVAVGRDGLRLDWPIAAILAAFVCLLLPGLPRASDNPQMLEAFVDDEIWQALALDGTLHFPYGNPANFLDPAGRAYRDIPDYWGDIRYPGIFYYGGAMYALATPVYAVLRAVGAPPFPTGVIVLRAITLASAALALLFLYNFARRWASRAAGIMAVLVVMADPYFIYYTVNIHPDLLQVLFGVLALALAVRHAQQGDRASLLALGLACGFVQGSKFGGAWTMPMAGMALWWGVQQAGFGRAGGCEIGRRVLALGAAALAGWMITTPYAFLDPYYIKRAAAQMLAQGPGAGAGPFGQVTVWTWLTRIHDHIGGVAAALCGLTIARVALRVGIAGERVRPLSLALVLCLSQLLVYGSGKYWIELGYLLLAAGLMAVLAGDAVVALVRSAARRACARIADPARRDRIGERITAAAFAIGFLLFYPSYGLAAVSAILDPQLYRSSTQLALNRWSAEHVPPDRVILFDAYAYFDPVRFPHVIRSPHPNWPKVGNYRPDYLVLSSWVYASPHYRELIARQHRARDDTYLFSVRLYQDLLKTETPGPTDLPGIEYVAAIVPHGLALAPPWQPPPVPGLGWAIDGFTRTEQLLRLVIAKAELIRRPAAAPVVGSAFRIYRLDRAALDRGGPSSDRPQAMPRHRD
jgi:hypothetical protein